MHAPQKPSWVPLELDDTVWAWTLPVIATVSPMARVSMVVTRTGRASGAWSSSALRQEDSNVTAVTARSTFIIGR